jgi:hypothetical protein
VRGGVDLVTHGRPFGKLGILLLEKRSQEKMVGSRTSVSDVVKCNNLILK